MLPTVFIILAAVVGIGGITYGVVAILGTRFDFEKIKQRFPTYGKSTGVGYFIRSVDSTQQMERQNLNRR